MEFTNEGLELPKKDSQNLLRIFGFVIKEVEHSHEYDHPEPRRLYGLLAPLIDIVEQSNTDLVLVPNNHIESVAELAQMTLGTEGLENEFCTSGYEHPFRSALLGDAYRALALAADINETTSIDPTSSELIQPVQNKRRLYVV